MGEKYDLVNMSVQYSSSFLSPTMTISHTIFPVQHSEYCTVAGVVRKQNMCVSCQCHHSRNIKFTYYIFLNTTSFPGRAKLATMPAGGGGAASAAGGGTAAPAAAAATPEKG